MSRIPEKSMEVCTPAQTEFYLTNNASRPPDVHYLYEQTTCSWQYVVADPSTKRCVIVDPVRDDTAEEVKLITQAADDLLDIVYTQGYIVDVILETGSGSAQAARSAAWYVRMQLTTRQGFAPQIATSGGTVPALERLFERKYGARGLLQSNHQDVFATGSHVVGRMRIQAVPIPGILTPRRRMYIIGPCVFGAHSLAMAEVPYNEADIQSEDSVPTHSMANGSMAWTSPARSRDTQLYTAMMRVLTLPETSRLYFDCGTVGQDIKSLKSAQMSNEAFQTVDWCRNANPYVGLTEQEFIIRRNGERKIAVEMAAVQSTKKRRWKKTTSKAVTTTGRF